MRDLYGLKTGSASHHIVKVVLAESLYSTGNAPGQASFSCNMSRKAGIEDLLRFVSNATAFGAKNNTLCCDLMFFCGPGPFDGRKRW